MLFNFLKIAYRNLFKQKALSLINTVGLSIGIACFSLFLRTSFKDELPGVQEVVRWKGAWNSSFVKIRPGDPFAAIQKMEASSKIIEPNLPFKYSFLDEDLNRFYRAEKRFASITAWAGSLSILLACLGLLGLSALSVVNRTKEIGIRKVLGANVLRIVSLLSGDFLKLVVIALLLASPLAYYFIDQWLENFAFRINIEWRFFAIAGLISTIMAVLTVSFQSVKAAMNNPIESLRTE